MEISTTDNQTEQMFQFMEMPEVKTEPVVHEESDQPIEQVFVDVNNLKSEDIDDCQESIIEETQLNYPKKLFEEDELEINDDQTKEENMVPEYSTSIYKQEENSSGGHAENWTSTDNQFNYKVTLENTGQQHLRSPPNIKAHIKTHTGEKSYSCSHCEYKAARKFTLVKHIKTHLGVKPFACEFCNYTNADKYWLKIHKRRHTNDSMFSCSVCEYKTVYKRNLKCHVWRIHSEERPFSCDQCDFKAIDKSALKSHLLVHSEKTLSCSVCEFKTAYKHHLKSHVRIHNMERPFSCDQCDFKAINKSTLKRHLLVHSEKRFSCSVCEFKTVYKRNFKSHMRIHSEERPFGCDRCGFKATTELSLKKHLLVHSDKTLCLRVQDGTQTPFEISCENPQHGEAF